MSNRRQSGLWSHNPQTGYFEQQPNSSAPYQYYTPPTSQPPTSNRRSYSDRAANSNDPQRAESKQARHGRTASEQVAQPKQACEGGDAEIGAMDPDSVPDNMRAKPWSPEPMSPSDEPQQLPKQRQASKAPGAEPVRRGSVPGKSPLQKLEGQLDEYSKEEKRARIEQAEGRARQKSGGDGDMLRGGSLKDTRHDGKGRNGYAAPERGGSMRNPQDQSRDVRATDGMGRQAPSARAPAVAGDMQRTASGKYRHRLRDAGFAGAAAAAAGGATSEQDAAAERGKAAHERRKNQIQASQGSASSPGNGLGRSGSNKMQKRSLSTGQNASYTQQNQRAASLGDRSGKGRLLQQTRNDHVGGQEAKKDRQMAQAHQDPDPVSPAQVATNKGHPVPYRVPPQTTARQQAKEQVGLVEDRGESLIQEKEKHHRFGGLFHRGEHRSHQKDPHPLEEWRHAQVARLTSVDMENDDEPQTTGGAQASAPWWDKSSSRRTSSAGSKQATPTMHQFDGPYEEEAKVFRPSLFLKCGPLLRYTGMRTEKPQQWKTRTAVPPEKEVWRGTVMIVTEDAQSDYASPPTLRLFAQHMDLHQPPPKQVIESGHQLPPEYEDPVAGQVKVSRTGRPLYVRSVGDIEGGIDLSREENNYGLYAATRPPMLGPQSSTSSEPRQSTHVTFQDKSRIKRKDGEKAGRYREVKAARLHAERGFTFWRFNIEIELGTHEHRVAYRINKGPALGFWVPARGVTMNTMFHSCNGFSLSVDPDSFSGPDPLWRDVLNRHQSRPFHVMIGGGDQIYNDAAMRDTDLFREWLQMKNPEAKHSADFDPELQDELEEFYFDRYSMWFSQGLFAMANSQIPMVNMWDDHDIIDGFGSYPHHFMSSRVFSGLGNVAFKYYMLFQHHSLPAETEKEEPSWALGASPGPYINELSRHVFVNLGKKVAFLGMDCRTERMRDEVLSQETYDLLFARVRRELDQGHAKHLLVLLGVPIAYPRLNFLENILTSKVMDPIKALGRTGMLGGFVNKFDGGVEILDDLDDHWTAKHHKPERNWFIQELQELAAEKSVRVTILGGDVHLGAVGTFYTPARFGMNKHNDHRYMPNIVSSAIANTPPPTMMADVLNKRNKIHHLDEETDESMLPLFETDIDGSARNNKCLLPRRNYCTIREFLPGTTPPPSPGLNDMDDFTSPTPDQQQQEPAHPEPQKDRRFPPGSMNRTMSLTRGPANLVRRLSGSKNKPTPPSRSNSLSGPPSSTQQSSAYQTAPERPTNQFHRRPTDLSEKAATRKSQAAGQHEHPIVDLEGGLDIALNMEVDQLDPAGATVPYRLLVPALWYEGPPDFNPEQSFKGRRPSLLQRFRGWSRADGDGQADDDGSLTPSPPPEGQRVGAVPQHLRQTSDDTPISPNAAPQKTANSFGHDGARPSLDQRPGGDSYAQGYALSPPLGAGNVQQSQQSRVQQKIHQPLINQQQQQQPTTRRGPTTTTTVNGPNIAHTTTGTTTTTTASSTMRYNSAQPGAQSSFIYPSSSAASSAENVAQPQQSTGRNGNVPAGDEDAASFTGSEGSFDSRDDGARPGARPGMLSKAEKFFGVGDDRVERMQQDEGMENAGKKGAGKKGWKIWK